MLILPRRLAKPRRVIRPDLSHPQLDDLVCAWYMQEGSGDMYGDGRYPNILGASSTAQLNGEGWGHGGRAHYGGVAAEFYGTNGSRFEQILLNSQALTTNQTWVMLATPKTVTGQDVAVDGANRQLRLETYNGGWQGAIGNGGSWNINHFANAGTPSPGRTALVAVTNSPTDNARLHVFDDTGYYTADSTNSHACDETAQLYVGNVRTGSGFGYDGFIHALWWFSAILDPIRLRALWEDPWAPLHRPVLLGAIPGPTTKEGTGALQAQDAAVSGLGIASGAKEGTGALQAQDAAVSGVGISVWEGTGALVAQSAAVSGVGAIVQEGTGALQAQDAAVAGVGEVGAVKDGTGVLQAQDAAVSGSALRIPVGAGALQAGSAAVTGEGVAEGLIAGTGILQAQPAAVVGAGEFTFTGTGTLQAQSATVAGDGFLLGDLTLTPGDLAAIQEAVWAKLVNEGLVAQINELWQRRGLDAANPQTYDKAGNQIRVGNVTIDLTGDQNAVTQTRRP